MPIAGIYGPDDFGRPGRAHPAPAPGRVSAAEPARALPRRSLQWTPEVERATAHLYERVKHVRATSPLNVRRRSCFERPCATADHRAASVT